MKTIRNAVYIGFVEARLAKFLANVAVYPEFARPAVWEFEDLIVVPGIRGLYTADGSRLDCSNLLYVTDQSMLSEGDRLKFENSWGPAQLDMRAYPTLDRVSQTTHFFGNYGGEIVGGRSHYGHFVTDHCSRLWNSSEFHEGEQRVFIPLSGSEEDRHRQYISEMLTTARLRGPCSDAITVPTRFSRMKVNESAFQARYAIYHNADLAFINAAERILQRRSDEANFGRKVYLSRLRLNDGMRNIANEAEVEALFVKRGFKVVYPEKLSLEQQIRIFNTAEEIAGFAGSAFHTGMFSFKSFNGTLIIVCGDEPLNGRLFLQSAIKNSRTIFLKVGNYTPNVGSDVKATIAVDVALLDAQLETMSI